MSEGEKQTMDKKSAVARQLPAPVQRDAGSYATSRNGKQNFATRKDFSGGVRPASDSSLLSRKPQQTVQQSKNRVFDKRVRAPRGAISSDSKEEVTTGETPTESFAEFGSVESWGSKKRNLNHLLNFHYESRDLYNGSHWKGNGLHVSAGKASVRRGYNHGSVPFNKERFLQANCQFVVRAGRDYAVHASDPDTLVDWELIEQVCICSHEVPSCPICLFPPVAAKITRCGHIFCWSCMLHYLSLDDRTWRKCPICYEAVHEKDLKSVAALEKHQYVVGEQMVMKLMKKSRGSTLVMPAIDWRPGESFPASVNGSEISCYAKLLVADVSDVKSILSKERQELEQQLKDEGESTLEATYVSAALNSLMEREQKLICSKPANSKNLTDLVSPSSNNTERHSVQSSDYEVVSGAVASVETVSPKTDHSYLSAFDEVTNAEFVDTDHDRDACLSEESSSPETANDAFLNSSNKELSADKDVCDTVESLVLANEGDQFNDSSSQVAESMYKNRQADMDDAFYFYQAADGQHIYMHAVNIRCLVKQYGSLRNCPDTVIATVMELEPVSMDEDSRRRLRYLNHLPLTCEFVMAELDLKPPVVSKQVLDEFAEELEKRHRNRVKRARDDKRRAYCIQREENRKMGIDPTMRIVRSDYVRPPDQCAASASDPHAETPLGTSPGNQLQQQQAVESSGRRTESTSSQDSVTLTSVPSFAEMLKIGKAKAPTEAWPVRSAQKMAESGGRERCTSGDYEYSEMDEYMSMAPRHHASLSDAIQAALDSYSKESDNQAVSEQGSKQASCAGSAGTTSKKKKTKKLLFSTGLPRNS